MLVGSRPLLLVRGGVRRGPAVIRRQTQRMGYPLRRVLDEVPVRGPDNVGYMRSRLECGHVVYTVGQHRKRHCTRVCRDCAQIASFVREARLRKGFSVAELAKRAGVAIGTASNTELGRTRPTRLVRRAIAAALEVEERMLWP